MAQLELGSRTGRSPTVPEIAQYLEVVFEDVLEALEAIAARHAAPLDAPVVATVDYGLNNHHDALGAEDDA